MSYYYATMMINNCKRASHALLLTCLWLIACQNAPEVTKDTLEPQPCKGVELMEDAYNVGFLVMDGVYNTELTAPYDIFQHTKYREGIKPMNVFTVAPDCDVVKTFEGIYLLPAYSMESQDLPAIDILVIPSAENHMGSDLEDQRMIRWVKEVAADADYVTSHCDGAFVLAEAGLLDDHESTTFPSDIAAMRKRYPDLTIHDDVLVVHDGKMITSAGGARSFDGALYLAELLYGEKIARRLAQGLVIDWDLEEVAHIVVRSKDKINE